MTDKPKSLPPRDSWITLAPGEAMTLDGPLQSKWQELTRRGREIRGNVLAHSFAVEFSLDNVIARVLFPEHRSSDPSLRVRADLFDELILKGRGQNFASKTGLLRKLRVRVPKLAETIAEDVLTQLDVVRDVRNRFAHYPITFKPITADDGQLDLSMWLVCRDQEIELTPEFLATTGDTISAVQAALEAANTALHETEAEQSGG